MFPDRKPIISTDVEHFTNIPCLWKYKGDDDGTYRTVVKLKI